jgi:uncharacterized protein (TIGR02186 family)
MGKRFFIIIFMLIASGRQIPLWAQAQDVLAQINIAPDLIRIHAFYKGENVNIRAELPDGCDGAVLKIQGEDEEITLNRKGRISIFWLNVDEVTVSKAPGIYMVNSSGPLDRISTLKDQIAWTLGYKALQQRIQIQSRNELSGSEFSEFVALKEHNGSYQSATSAQLTQDPANRPTLKAVFKIPPVMPSGNYQIQLFCFKNLVFIGQTSGRLRVEKVGLPNLLYSLAYAHPAAYGLLAIIIAMATGIMMGVIFGSRSRRKQ